jgi:membrane associated rhomboid family serine protease
MGFLFDIPLMVTGPILLVVLVGGTILALNAFRRHVLPRLRFGEGDGDFNAAMVASIMVFYGLATALIAVNVWEAYEKIREVTKQEAASLAVLYRNVSEYPEPVRGVLREEIRAYTYRVIHESWPLQRRGRVPTQGVGSMDRLQSALMRFEPVSEAQKGLALETLASYSRLIDARRMRVDSVERRLPGVLWLVIILGAFISLVSAFFFPVLDARVHRTQVGLLATFIGLVIFIILALDRPYDGDLGLTPEPYEIVYKQLMAP